MEMISIRTHVYKHKDSRFAEEQKFSRATADNTRNVQGRPLADIVVMH